MQYVLDPLLFIFILFKSFHQLYSLDCSICIRVVTLKPFKRSFHINMYKHVQWLAHLSFRAVFVGVIPKVRHQLQQYFISITEVNCLVLGTQIVLLFVFFPLRNPFLLALTGATTVNVIFQTWNTNNAIYFYLWIVIILLHSHKTRVIIKQ